MKIEKVDLRLVGMPLKHYFETSSERVDHEEHIIVRIFSEGNVGYGETAVMTTPNYTYETVETAWHIMKDFLIPAILHKNIPDIHAFERAISTVRGHNMSKCGLEGAFWHLVSLNKLQPLFQIWGGVRNTIQSGVSIGIQDSLEALCERVGMFMDEGYKRIKIKIKPGWDINVVTAIRKRFGDIPLMVDANAAYSLADLALFKDLDSCRLMMIEQPFHYEDLTDHAVLQKQISTPVCLDESIASFKAAEAAIALGSCRIINIKPGRVGGYHQAVKIHDLCMSANIPVWCGGMLEFGIGRAFNMALCSLQNFHYPGDISSSSRYYQDDIVTPNIEFSHGEFTLPDKPGIGFQPDDARIDRNTLRSYSSS